MGMIRKKIFNTVKNLIPKISETELIALRSGTTSLDRDIFCGKVEFPKSFPQKDFISESNDKNINDLLQKYEGNKISVNELSNILVKITSKNPALGVTIMVP